MKFVITGAGGQLGREWCQFARKNKMNYRAFTSAELDVTDPGTTYHLLTEAEPDYIINCAAYTGVDNAEVQPDKADEVNHLAVQYLSEWCEKNKTVLIHFSTDYVFPGDPEDRSNFPSGYREDFRKDPVNIYGKTKMKGENALIRSGADFLLIRVSWLCGQFGKNFVTTMLELSETNDQIEVVNDQWGSPAFADNVVKLTYRLIQKNESGIFHISSGGTINWYEFACEIFKQSKINMKVVPVSSHKIAAKARRPSYSKLDCSKISRTLGAEMENWKSGLSRLLTQLKQRSNHGF